MSSRERIRRVAGDLPTETGWYYVKVDSWYMGHPAHTIFPIYVKKQKNGRFRVDGRQRSDLSSITLYSCTRNLTWYGPVAIVEEF